MKKLNTLIYGANGYIGLELVNLLMKHKYISIKYLCGKSSVGKNYLFTIIDSKIKNYQKLSNLIKNYLRT